MKKYELLEHTADLKIRAFGKTKEEIFTNMAIGMFDNIADEDNLLKDQQVEREIEIESVDLESLLVDFLSQLLYLSDTNDEIYADYRLNISDYKITGEVKGYKVKRIKLDIKAVTYNDLKIEKKNSDWVAEIVFDI